MDKKNKETMKKVYGFIITFLLLLSPLFCLDPAKNIGRFVMRKWTIRDGLPNMTIRSILQTRDGYLWVGTFNGLARFDGVRFRSFNRENTPEIPHNTINCLYEDSRGDLWVGTYIGVLRYRDGVFSSYTVKDGLSSDVVYNICEDRDGRLWFGSTRGLNLLENDTFTHYLRKDGLSADFIAGLVADDDGSLWIATTSGLDSVIDKEIAN
ncbi:MAG: hypothetical protein GY765_28995 [bacterium]|nr:hypothetical protein [bacterium]